MNVNFKKGYRFNLFTWKELETLINIRPLMTNQRVIFPVPVPRFEWKNSGWALAQDCWPATILQELIEERIFYIKDISQFTEDLNDFAKNLEEEYNGDVDAHIYVCRNPAIEHPFQIHYDRSDNVIVQCEGVTNFKVWEEVKDPHHEFHHLEMDSSPILDVDMKPGDAIWIPRYYPHLATSKTKRLSVSFPITDQISPASRAWIRL